MIESNNQSNYNKDLKIKVALVALRLIFLLRLHNRILFILFYEISINITHSLSLASINSILWWDKSLISLSLSLSLTNPSHYLEKKMRLFLDFCMWSRGVLPLFEARRSRMGWGTNLTHQRNRFGTSIGNFPNIYFIKLIKLGCSSNILVDITIIFGFCMPLIIL